MCDVLQELLSESKSDDNEGNSSRFSELYKYSTRSVAYSQNKKRELFLQKQKEQRSEAFDEKRDLSQLFGEDDESPEPMEYETANRHKSPKKFPFGFKLMGSEWWTDVPDDLAENWLVKLCPEGVRYLVVANRGITTCYFRNGRQSFKFKSKLPGGSADCGHRFTVLDCIHSKVSNTLFVYDVLAWNSTSLLNAEAYMRFCWLRSKFDDNPELCRIHKEKRFNFVVVDFFPAQRELVQDRLFTTFTVNECDVCYDGVLFYHKEGHYIFGRSPLVGWLKTFMLPEMLQIDVDPSHTSKKPKDYESVELYLRSKKKHFKKGVSEDCHQMEMESVDEVESIEQDNM